MNVATITVIGTCFTKSIETDKGTFDTELRATLKGKLMLAAHGAASLRLRDGAGALLDEETRIIHAIWD